MTPGDSTDPKVQALLDDLEAFDTDRYRIVRAARAVIRGVAPNASEKVMYGGIMVSDGEAFCGVFAYKQHVSVEFGQGAEMDDPRGVLEGKGKYRRHIKFHDPEEVEKKDLPAYVRQAHELSGEKGEG